MSYKRLTPVVVSSDTPTRFLASLLHFWLSLDKPSRMRPSTILNSGLSVVLGSGRVLSLAYASSALTPSATNTKQLRNYICTSHIVQPCNKLAQRSSSTLRQGLKRRPAWIQHTEAICEGKLLTVDQEGGVTWKQKVATLGQGFQVFARTQ